MLDRKRLGALAAAGLGALASGCGDGTDLRPAGPEPAYAGVEIRVSSLSPFVLRTSAVPRDVQGFVAGSARLTVAGTDPAAADVMLNGVSVPRDPRDARYWDVTSLKLPEVGPGSALVLDAKVGDLTGRHVFSCPPAVSVSVSPDPIVPGQPVTIRWRGELWWNGPGSIAPAPEVRVCYIGLPQYQWVVSCSTERAAPPRGASEVTLVPPIAAPGEGYAVEFSIPGRLTQAQFPASPFPHWHQGICVLEQTVPVASTR